MSKSYNQYIKRIWAYIETSLDNAAQKNKELTKYINKFYCKLYLDVKINDRINRYWASCQTEVKNHKIVGFTLEFNPEIFESKMTIKFRREIITHELAHCIDEVMRGEADRYHDAHWQYIHKLLGGTGKRLIDPKDVI